MTPKFKHQHTGRIRLRQTIFIIRDSLNVANTPREEDQALVLGVHWVHVRHAFIEAVVKAARSVLPNRVKAGWDYAEGLLGRDVKKGTLVGNEADKFNTLL